jgi:hypothetical protein
MSHRHAHIPVGPLVAIALVAAGVGGWLGSMLTGVLGWPEAGSSLVPSYLGAGVVLLVGVFAALAMHLQAGNDERRVANALLAGTGVRLLGVLFGGLIVSLVIQQDRPMWLGLLCAGALALVMDTLVLMKAAGATGSPASHDVHSSLSSVKSAAAGMEKQSA